LRGGAGKYYRLEAKKKKLFVAQERPIKKEGEMGPY